MNLNPQHPNTAEQRMKKRKLLEAEAIEYIRKSLQDELLDAPAEWSAETLKELEHEKIAESQRLLDALGISELEHAFALQRHSERAVSELRMEVRQRISEGRTQL